MNVKEWVIKNVSAAYIAVKLKNEKGEIVRSFGLAPQSETPVRNIFRAQDGSADVAAARANEDVIAHQAANPPLLELAEREVWRKEAAGPGPLFNENDPESTRVEKILQHRQQQRAEARAAAAGRTRPAPRSSKPDKEKE